MGSTGICHSGHKHTWYSICIAQQLKASGISCTDRLHRSITIRVTKCTVSRLIFTACRIRFCIGCTVTDIIMNLFYGLISGCTSRELLIDRFRCFRHDRIHLRLCSINWRFFDIGRNTWNCYILYHTIILIQLRRIIWNSIYFVWHIIGCTRQPTKLRMVIDQSKKCRSQHVTFPAQHLWIVVPAANTVPPPVAAAAIMASPATNIFSFLYLLIASPLYQSAVHPVCAPSCFILYSVPFILVLFYHRW